MDYDYFPEIARQLGRQGGKKTLEKHGKEHFKRISDLATKARAKRKLTQFDIETDTV